MEESVKNPKNLNKIQTNVEQCSEHLRLRKPIITVLRYVMDKLVLSLMVMEMKTQLIECCKITYDNEDGDDGDVGDVGDGGDDGDGGDGGDRIMTDDGGSDDGDGGDSGDGAGGKN